MSKTTSYWKQKNRADSAEKELKHLRLRCSALVSNWALIARKSAAGSPRQTIIEQCRQELETAMRRAQEAAAAPVEEPAKKDVEPAPAA